jgi:hypothetical protein
MSQFTEMNVDFFYDDIMEKTRFAFEATDNIRQFKLPFQSTKDEFEKRLVAIEKDILRRCTIEILEDGPMPDYWCLQGLIDVCKEADDRRDMCKEEGDRQGIILFDQMVSTTKTQIFDVLKELCNEEGVDLYSTLSKDILLVIEKTGLAHAVYTVTSIDVSNKTIIPDAETLRNLITNSRYPKEMKTLLLKELETIPIRHI